MAEEDQKSLSEVLRRGYSDDEIAHIYELGRWSLENGDLRRGETILLGVTEIAPEFAPAWLGVCYVHVMNKRNDEALRAAREAVRVSPHMPEAILFLVSCLLTAGDYNSAGTYLGEIGEQIDDGTSLHPNLVRFYKAQLVRYQNRSSNRALSEAIRPRLKSP